jgi:hypothetical protein
MTKLFSFTIIKYRTLDFINHSINQIQSNIIPSTVLALLVIIGDYYITHSTIGYILVPFFLFFVLIISIFLKWFGFLSFFLINPVFFPNIGSSQIPLIGQIIPMIPLQQVLLLIFFVSYIFYGGLKQMIQKERFRLQFFPWIPIFAVATFGLFVCKVFALNNGTLEFEYFFRNVFYGVMIFTLTYKLIDTPQKAMVVVDLLALSGLIFCVVINIPSISETYIPDNSGAAVNFGGTWKLPYAMGVWMNSGTLGPCLAITITLAWGKFITKPKGNLFLPIFWGFSILLMLFTLIKTFSRTALVGVIIGVFIVSIFSLLVVNKNVKKIKLPSLLLYLLFIILLLITFFLVGNLYLSNYMNTFDNSVINYMKNKLSNPMGDLSVLTRINIFQYSLKINVQYFWGIGFTGLLLLFGIPEHNLFTFMLSGLGIIGSFFFAILIIWTIFSNIRFLFSNKSIIRQILIFPLSGIIQIMIMGLGFPIIESVWGVTLFWTQLALASILLKLVDE